MNFRIALVYFLICLFVLSGSQVAYAQKNDRKRSGTSQQVAPDPAREAQKRYLDSIRIARQHRSDSLAAIRKYRESKRYKDSVVRVRQEKLEAIQATRKRYFDSLKAARQKVLDSTLAARKAITDQIKARQKKRTDSLAAIRKYRESKRYRDSTALARQNRLDSIKNVRKLYNDSVASARKAYNDSIAGIRKAQMDSVTAARTKYLDSIKAKRQLKADSIAKKREIRKKSQEARLKDKEKKMQMAFELKLKKKREAWSNEKMLKKKWSFPRSGIQNTFTHYNYYFNTDKKMDEALDNMQRARKENYDSALALFPFDPDRDSALLSSDMDSIIQKASIGIQIHDPRTKWGDDLYLLLGQAYYYKGGYEEAATSFRYIVYLDEQNNKKNRNKVARAAKAKPVARPKPGTAPAAQRTAPSIVQADNKGMLDFLKHRSVHNEALLWLARTYTEAHQEGNAESVIDLLETDPNLPQSLKGRVAVEKAYVSLSQSDYKQASEQLEIVAADKDLPDWLRQRAAFLNGQLYQEAGNYAASAKSFEKVIDLRPKIDMDFYARKNLAYSMMLSGGSQEDAVASLKRVLNDGKYAPYYEQVYYVMGRLSANSGKPDEAITYLRKSIEAPKSTKKQKALSFAVLGGVYYDLHDYVASKNAYDSAVAMGGAINDSLIVIAAKRSASLGEISGPVNTIHTQDSLLALAALSDKEQYNAVRKYIRYLENLKNDSAFRAQNQAFNNAMQNDANNMMSNNGGTNYTNWYFSNAALMQQGVNEFKRKWGNRPNADNWRRLAAMTISGNNKPDNGGESSDDENAPELDENGLPTEESLLAMIPNSAERKDAALKKVRRAYVDLGTAYIKLLEDYPQAIHSFDTLDQRFPAHEHKAEVLYLRYLVALKQNRLSEAQGYASQLQTQYGDSKWAKLVRPTEDGEGMPRSDNNATVANYYDETYGLLLQRQYPEALQKVQAGQKMYSDPGYLKRFRIIEAIALVGVNDYDRADTLVTDFISKNPTDSLRRWAEAVMTYIKKNRVNAPPAPAGATVPVKMPAAGEASKPDSVGGIKKPDMDAIVKQPVEKAPDEYSYKPQEEHYVIFAFRNMEQRAMGVKAAMTDFNTFKFGNLNLTSGTEMPGQSLGMVVTRKFQNAGQAKIYLNTLKSTAQVFREYAANEYQLVTISASNYLKLVNDKTIEPYLNFYRKHYK